MEEQIVKVPKDELLVSLSRSGCAVPGRVCRKKHLRIDEQPDQLRTREIVQKLLHALRAAQARQHCSYLRIANPEQCRGERGFENELVGTAPQISEPGEEQHFAPVELGRSRPVVRNLRLDDDLVLTLQRAGQAVLQETMPGQSPDQGVGLLRRRGRSAEREADGQLRYPRRRGRTELSQADMLVIERDKDFSARARLKRDGADEPGEKAGRAGAPRVPVGAGLTQAGRTSRWRKIRIQRALRNRAITKSDLDGNIVQPAGREATIEVPHSGDDHPDNRHPDVGPGLVQHDEIETLLLDELDAGDHLLSVVEMAEIGPGGGRDRSIVAWQEVGMLVQPPRARAVRA